MNTPQRLKITAIILAAGYSSRMQLWKPLLLLGAATVVAQAVDLFRRSGIDDIIVVAGHRADELAGALKNQPVRCVLNERFEQGMYGSVATGIRALATDAAAFFLLPVDMPLIKRRTLRLLVRCFSAGKGKIVYPVFQGQRGHPPLISTEFSPAILAADRPCGLRSLLDEHESAAAEVQVLDEGILMDMDEPADYCIVQERFRQRGIPSPAECAAILARMKTRPGTVQHGRQVARVASALAAELNNRGLELNTFLLEAAGVLHDLAKGRKNHARAGGRILRVLGFDRVAELVERHMDLEFDPDSLPNEAALLYLADKLTLEDRLVTVEEHFALALSRYNDAGPASAAILHRLGTARSIERAVGGIFAGQAENMASFNVSNLIAQSVQTPYRFADKEKFL